MQLTAADLAAADDPTKLAILESMLLAVFADGQVHSDEIRVFNRLAEALPWGMDKEVLTALIHGAQERMKALTNPTAISDFVIGIALRVPSQGLRQKILYTMAVLAAADGSMHSFEKNLLGLVAVAFNLTSDTVRSLKDALAAAAAKPA